TPDINISLNKRSFSKNKPARETGAIIGVIEQLLGNRCLPLPSKGRGEGEGLFLSVPSAADLLTSILSPSPRREEDESAPGSCCTCRGDHHISSLGQSRHGARKMDKKPVSIRRTSH